MANSRQRKLSDLNDRHLAFNGKNYIYSDLFTGNKGYILTNEDSKKYVLFSARLMFAASVAVLLFFVLKQTVLAAVAFVVFYVFLEVLFRTNFLAKLPVINNYERPAQPGLIEGICQRFSKTRLILLAVFGFGLVVLIPVNVKLQGYEGLLMYANYAISMGLAMYEVLLIIAIAKKAKEK